VAKKVNANPSLISRSTIPLKALVTGATGFIGSHLVELLLKKKYAVRILLRRSSDTVWLEGLDVERVYGDLSDLEALRRAVEGVDYVYHSAGVTKSKKKEGYFRGNTQGTKNILDAVRKHNPGLRRFIQISSQTAVGPSPTRAPIDETVAAHPITTYGQSKWQAEVECRHVGAEIPVTILRAPAVFGPRDKDVYEFFSTMTRGLQPMVGMSEKYVSLIHVGDLVRGFVMAAECEKAKGETYFISSADIYGWKEVGEVTRRVLGKMAVRLRIPEFGVYIVATFAELFSLFSSKPALINYEKARDMVQDYWTCDSAKAKRDFGYEQEISLEAGIRDTVGWYKSKGWL